MARFTTFQGTPNFTTLGTQYANIYVPHYPPEFVIIPDSPVTDEGREVNFTVSQLNANLVLTRDYFWDIEFEDDENLLKYANVSFYDVMFGNTVGTANLYLTDITGNITEVLYSETGSREDRSWERHSIQYEVPLRPYRLVWHYVGPTSAFPDGEGDYALDTITINESLYKFDDTNSRFNWVTTYGNPNLTEDYDSAEEVLTGRTRTLINVPQPLTTSLGTFFVSSETAGFNTGPEGAQDGEFYVLADTTGSSDANVAPQCPVNFWLISPVQPGKFGTDDFVYDNGKVSITENRGTLGIRIINDFLSEGEERFRVVLRSRRSSSPVAYSSYVTINDTSGGLQTSTYLSDKLFDSEGWSIWQVPENVTRITAIGVGAGGNGETVSLGFGGYGGGSGACMWAQDIAVTPGELLYIHVGIAGAGTQNGASIIRRDDFQGTAYQVNDIIYASGANGRFGGASIYSLSLRNDSNDTLAQQNGEYAVGGNDGSDGGAGDDVNNGYGGGGAGAGGYVIRFPFNQSYVYNGQTNIVSRHYGEGGRGGTASDYDAGMIGLTGGAGGAAGGNGEGGGGGGGIGVYGLIDGDTRTTYINAQGTSRFYSDNGGYGYGLGEKGDSGITNQGGDGGKYGGGGGGGANGGNGGRGAQGAVRIVWTTNANFPRDGVYKTEFSDVAQSSRLVPYDIPYNETWWAATIAAPDDGSNIKIQNLHVDTFTSNIVALAKVERIGNNVYNNAYAIVRMTDQGNILSSLITSNIVGHTNDFNVQSTLMNNFDMIVAFDGYDQIGPVSTSSNPTSNLYVSCVTRNNTNRWYKKIETIGIPVSPVLCNTDNFLYLYFRDTNQDGSANIHLFRMDPLTGDVIWQLEDMTYPAGTATTGRCQIDSDSRGNVAVYHGGGTNWYGVNVYNPDGEVLRSIGSFDISATNRFTARTKRTFSSLKYQRLSNHLRLSYVFGPDPTQIDSSDLADYTQSWYQSYRIDALGRPVSGSGYSYGYSSAGITWSGNDPTANLYYGQWSREGYWRTASSLRVGRDSVITIDQNDTIYRSETSVTPIFFGRVDFLINKYSEGDNFDYSDMITGAVADVYKHSLYAGGYSSRYSDRLDSTIYKLPISEDLLRGGYQDTIDPQNNMILSTFTSSEYRVGTTTGASFNITEGGTRSASSLNVSTLSSIGWNINHKRFVPNVISFYEIADTKLKPIEVQWSAVTGLANVISSSSVSSGGHNYVALINHNNGTLLDSNLKYSAGIKYTNAKVSIHKIDNKGELVKSIVIEDGANSACKLGRMDTDIGGNVFLIYSYIDTNAWTSNVTGLRYGAYEKYLKVRDASPPKSSVNNGSRCSFIGANGTKLYDFSSDVKVVVWDLATPWDVSTATLDTTNFINAKVDLDQFGGNESTPSGIYLSPDGTKLFVLGDSTNRLIRYDLSTPWDVSTAVYATNKNLGTGNWRGLYFKPDGTRLFMVNWGTDRVTQWELSTAWDITTATQSSTFLISDATRLYGLAMSESGDKMYVSDLGTPDSIFEYDLSTPWDISTMSLVVRIIGAYGNPSPDGIFLKPDGTVLYLTAFTYIYQVEINARKIDHVILSIDKDLSTVRWQNRILGDTEFGCWFVKKYSDDLMVASAGAELFRIKPTDGSVEYTQNRPAGANATFDAVDNDGRYILRYWAPTGNLYQSNRYRLIEWQDMNDFGYGTGEDITFTTAHPDITKL